MGVAGAPWIGAVAIFEDEVSERHLRGDEDDAHDHKGHGKLVIDGGGRGGSSGGQPPGLGDKKVSAGYGNQPDDTEKQQPHESAPCRDYLNLPDEIDSTFAAMHRAPRI